MITFNVSKELHGWSVSTGEGSTTPYWSKDLAVTRAKFLAAAMRRHGQSATVVVGEESASFAPVVPIATVVKSLGTT